MAVREALINFIIHPDYSENASLIARLYKNSIVLSNPGTMLVSKQQYYCGGDSVCRNKALQTMFLMLGSAEKAGSGVDKILKGWREQNWRSPIIETKCQPDKVELTLKMESVMDEDIKGQLVTLYGNNILNIGHDRLLVLNMACADGFVTNESLRYVLNIHKTDITELLREMCASGLLVAEGYGRGTKYRLINLLAKDATSDAKVATSDAKVATSSVNVATSNANKVATSNINKVATSDTKVATSENNQQKSIKKRMKPTELDRLISEKCEDWISLDELAVAINRSYTYLRNKVIPRLIEEKILEMMFPGVPNHPSQKYKRKEK